MQVDFFFGPGSRYSYLASTQLDRVSAETGATFRWRPVLSMDLTARTGGVPRSPQDPAWRTTDVERWARHYRVAFRDVEGDMDWRRIALMCAAAQVLGAAEPFARAVYASTYGRDDLPDDQPATSLVAVAGLEMPAFEDALEGLAPDAYAANLEGALAAGAFGVPSFVTPDGAVFWGQDRLPLLVDHLKTLGG
jgi:2-hydroxychromene-2-carboxylate isomerase